MTSLYNSIYHIMVKNNYITNAELLKIFVQDNPKTIKEYASRIRNILQKKKSIVDTKEVEPKQKKINIELIEPIIYNKITKNPTNQDLKLAVEILKLKQASKGMDDDLDLDKFILTTKKLKEVIDNE